MTEGNLSAIRQVTVSDRCETVDVSTSHMSLQFSASYSEFSSAWYFHKLYVD